MSRFDLLVDHWRLVLLVDQAGDIDVEAAVLVAYRKHGPAFDCLLAVRNQMTIAGDAVLGSYQDREHTLTETAVLKLVIPIAGVVIPVIGLVV